jgi:hypothetical protein
MLTKFKLRKLIRSFAPFDKLVLVRMVSTNPKIKPGEVPAGYKAHTESSTTILVPDSNTAFLNPVQQYNRDLSIAVIRSWNELRIEEAIAKQENKKSKGKGKGKKDVVTEDQPEAGPSKPVSVSFWEWKGLMSSMHHGKPLFWRHYQRLDYDQFDTPKKSQMSERYLRMISRIQHARPCA